ncbi:MAG: TIGR03936 family radical SAM-associated protein [Agathobacter sp.]|nr:TIGR03936 family radical SAM-associated protein [Agathobacter sp.]
MKIRIKFKKWGCMKFIGHLDMMRYFQKAIRRANIDICYSEGFSPHQIMSFAAPLGVGITSDGEYFDIEVNSSLTSKEALDALNSTMVEGVEVTEYVKLPDNAKTAMSLVEAADYTLSYKEGYNSPVNVSEWQEIINKYFHNTDSFNIIKKTKKSEREIDLKPLVYKLEVKEENGKPYFYIMLSTGSTNNIKPELVLESLYNKCGFEYKPEAIQIHRVDVYTTSDNKFIPLSEMGEQIL